MAMAMKYQVILRYQLFCMLFNFFLTYIYLMGDNKYVPLIIKSDDADPIKYYSTSAAARHCGVTKQMLDYTHKHRCSRIVRRKGGVKEFRITWL